MQSEDVNLAPFWLGRGRPAKGYFSSGLLFRTLVAIMNNLFSLRSGIIFSITLGLAACGGGGGGGSKPNPVPASSAAVSSSVSTSVVTSSLATLSSSLPESSSPPVATSTSSSVNDVSSVPSSSSFGSASVSSSSSSSLSRLTIQGAVTADALIGGAVKVAIGDNQFTAKIGDDKKYSVVLDVAEVDQQKPFSVIATGIGNNQWVSLAALLPSVDALTGLAGADKLLTAAEYPGVNITLLSTAEYAEMNNNRLSIANDAERENALLSLHPTTSMEQAAALSRLLNDPAADLPIQTPSTLDYLLDADIAESYLEILRISKKEQLRARIAALQDDPEQTYVSPTKISGNYFLETKDSQYVVTFNDDGTGVLRTATVGTDMWRNASLVLQFAWQRTAKKIQLTFDNAVNFEVLTVIAPVAGEDVTHYCDDGATQYQTETCAVKVKTIQLDLIDETDYRYLAQLRIDLAATRNGGALVYEGEITPEVSRLISLDNTVPITLADISGFEWFGDVFAYSFAADGKVKRTDLQTKVVTTLNWTLAGNRIVMDGAELLITHREPGGFSAVYRDAKNLYRMSLVKRVPVTLQESDWVGRWTSYWGTNPVTAYDARADKTWRDGFENGSMGSWFRVDGDTQTALSNGVWRMVRDLLAIHNGVYYFSVCHGVEGPGVASCYLSRDTRAVNFDSRVFWNYWSYPMFNELGGDGVWTYLNERAIFSNTLGGELAGRLYTKVSPTRVFNKATNSIIELTAASANGIEICEYAVNDACRDKDKRIYERGVEIGVTANTGGRVNYSVDYKDLDANASASISRNVEKVFMVPRNRAQKLSIVPSSGYQLGSVTGCGGSVNGTTYLIPALTDNCQVTVNFVIK